MSSARTTGLLIVAWMATSAATLAQEGALPGEFLTTKETEERALEARRNAPPALAVVPGELTMALTEGDRATASVSVRNTGGQVLMWTAKVPQWMSVEPSRGELGFEGLQTVSLTVRGDMLRPGRRVADLLIEAEGASGSPAGIPVVLTIEPKALRTEPQPREPRPHVTPPVTPAHGQRQSRHFGVRAGILVPSGGKSLDFEPGPMLGAYYVGGGNARSKMKYELGLDAALVAAADNAGSSQIVSGRAGLVVALSRADGASTSPYFASELAGIFVASETDTGTESTAYASSLSLGVGLDFASGLLDARLSYAFLLGSGNVEGMAQASLAARF